MKHLATRKGQFWHQLSQTKAPAWICCLWFALSAAFLAATIFIFRDETLSRNELLIVIAAFAISFLIAFALSQFFHLTGTSSFLIFALAAACGLLIAFQLPGLTLLRSYELEIIELDEGTEVELVWAYWAEFPHETDTEIIDYRHFRDISYSQFEKKGKWTISEQGYLASREKNASIRLNSNGIHFHLPVLCINSRNGRALVKETWNGTTNFYALNGKDTDALPTSGFRSCFIQNILTKILAGLATGGLLLAIFLMAGKLFIILRRKNRSGPNSILARDWSENKVFLLFAAFFIPILIMLAVCALLKVYPFGDGTFLRADMNGQYVDFLAYLRSILFSNNDFFYSFSKNLGGDMYSLAAYYLGNPINFLVVLFPLEALPKAISYLILLRIGLCGLTAHLYLRKIGKAGGASLIFSTAYALMAYNMMNAENIFFIDGVIFLPLVALGIEKLLSEDRPLCYILSLAAIMMINFYMGFMICIFAVLYFLYRLLVQFDFLRALSETKRPARALRAFLAASLLAAGIAAIVLIPVVKQLGSSPKYLDPSRMTGGNNFNLLDIFSKNISGAYDLNEYKFGLPTIYSGAIVTVFLILFFLNKKIAPKEKWLTAGLLGIFLASFQVNALNLIWHGFSEPNWWPFRNAFIFSFLMILIAWKSFLLRDAIEPRSIRTAFFLIAGVLILCEKFKYSYLTSGKIYFELFLTGTICLLLHLERRCSQSETSGLIPRSGANLLFLLITLVNLLHNSYNILKLNLSESTTLTAYVEATAPTDEILTELRTLDDGLYRLEKQYQRSENDALRYGTYGVGHFSSTNRQDEISFLNRLGINHLYYWTHYGEGSTMAVDSLLGIRYLLSKSTELMKPYPEVFSKNGIHVYQNPLVLPIGFLVSENFLYSSGWEDDPFAFQNGLFQSLTEPSEKVIFTPAAVTRTIDPVSQNETWTVVIDTTQPLYTYFFSPAERPESVTLNNGQSLLERFAGNRVGIVPLGAFQPGDVIAMTFNNQKVDTSKLNPLIYYENQAVLGQTVRELNSAPIDLNQVTGSSLSGTFTSSSADRYAFLSIPYDEGWSMLIDGQPAQPIRVLSDLTGIKVPEGTHHIEMSYRPQGFSFGAGISIFSALLLGAGEFLRKQSPIPLAG